MAGLYTVERMKGEVLASVAAEHQRLAVQRARRQAIAKAAADSGVRGGRGAGAASTAAALAAGASRVGGVGGSPSGGIRQPRVRFDLPAEEEEEGGEGGRGGLPPPLHPSVSARMARVPLTDVEALRQLDRHHLWHSSQAFARQVLAELRWAASWIGRTRGCSIKAGVLHRGCCQCLLQPLLLPLTRAGTSFVVQSCCACRPAKPGASAAMPF